MNKETVYSKIFKSSEELVSMLLGLAIVLIVVVMIFGYFNKKKGTINLAGVSDTNKVQIENNEQKTVDNFYTVKKGDSLWKIAVAKYGDGYKWTKIANDNKLTNPGVLVAGQKLKIADTVLAKGVENVDKSEITVAKDDNNQVKSYTVKKGDSLWKIAIAQYGDGYKWTEIWKLNQTSLRNPSRLEIGMMIKLK